MESIDERYCTDKWNQTDAPNTLRLQFECGTGMQNIWRFRYVCGTDARNTLRLQFGCGRDAPRGASLRYLPIYLTTQTPLIWANDKINDEKQFIIN